MSSIDVFTTAAALPNRVILEGFHALKHALRFGAELDVVVASKPFDDLVTSIAPDLVRRFNGLEISEISSSDLKALPG